MSDFQFSNNKSSASNSSKKNSFRCIHCGATVPLDAPGTRNRNHCPHCLWSRHVDNLSGDRKSRCHSAMEALAVSVNSQGEWSLIHRCKGCGFIRINRIAGDDNEFQLLAIAAKPLTLLPFPLAECVGKVNVE